MGCCILDHHLVPMEGEERNTTCSANQLQNLIIMRLSWWIKGWGDHFPYSTEDLRRNPSCLLWSPVTGHSPPKQSTNSSTEWIPPAERSLKWNVDASVNSSHDHRPLVGCYATVGGLSCHHVCIFQPNSSD